MTLFIGKNELQKEIAQQLLVLKNHGRSADNIASSLIVLADDEDTRIKLRRIILSGVEIANAAGALYNDIAREAFKE